MLKKTLIASCVLASFMSVQANATIIDVSKIQPGSKINASIFTNSGTGAFDIIEKHLEITSLRYGTDLALLTDPALKNLGFVAMMGLPLHTAADGVNTNTFIAPPTATLNPMDVYAMQVQLSASFGLKDDGSAATGEASTNILFTALDGTTASVATSDVTDADLGSSGTLTYSYFEDGTFGGPASEALGAFDTFKASRTADDYNAYVEKLNALKLILDGQTNADFGAAVDGVNAHSVVKAFATQKTLLKN